MTNLSDPENVQLFQHVHGALRAHGCYHRDVDYVVREGQVILVDEFTGRLMFGRRYSEGLHQAIEAKEGVKIERESQTIATITYQNYFRLYRKLGGMTGTAKTEEQEFIKIYGLPVVVVPTNKPMVREDHPDVIYKTEEAKFRGIISEILQLDSMGRPVLVGTRSIEVSERLSERLGAPKLQLFARLTLIWHRLWESKELGERQQTALSAVLHDRLSDTQREGRRLEQALEKLSDPDARRVSQPEEIRMIERQLRKLTDLIEAIQNILQKAENKQPLSGGEIRRAADIICYQRLEEVREARLPALMRELGIDPEVTAEANLRELGKVLGLEAAVHERLSELLESGIPHQVLNAKYHEQEAEIIKLAGEKGAVTIATNMAGRGVDIKLDETVTRLGGLHILGTERHESRRIDNQLRGRSGRQGDPGSSRFYVSWEDYLMRLFAPERVDFLLRGWHESEPIEHRLVSRSIENAQRKVEMQHFSMREHVLKYDDVMNFQREKIYTERRKVLMGTDLRESMLDSVGKAVAERVREHASPEVSHTEWDLEMVYRSLLELIPLHRALVPSQLQSFTSREQLTAYLRESAVEMLQASVLRHAEVWVHQFVPPEAEPEQWDLRGLADALKLNLPVNLGITPEELSGKETPDQVAAVVRERISQTFAEQGEQIATSAVRQMDRVIEECVPAGELPEGWDVIPLCEGLSEVLPEFHVRVAVDQLSAFREHQQLVAYLQQLAGILYEVREQEVGSDRMRQLERWVTLRVVSDKWMAHLASMDDLEEGIRLRAYGQRDPLIEFTKEAYEYWQRLLSSIQEEIVRLVFYARFAEEQREQPRVRVRAMSAGDVAEPVAKRPVRLKGKPSRNDPCPCGSGKKYKKCCMLKEGKG